MGPWLAGVWFRSFETAFRGVRDGKSTGPSKLRVNKSARTVFRS
jgi:hypothetical protein